MGIASFPFFFFFLIEQRDGIESIIIVAEDMVAKES